MKFVDEMTSWSGWIFYRSKECSWVHPIKQAASVDAEEDQRDPEERSGYLTEDDHKSSKH